MKKRKNYRLACLLVLLAGSLQLVAQPEIQLAQTFLQAHAAELGLQPSDYACLHVTNQYQSAPSQVQHYYFNQCHQGIQVHRAILNLHYKNGELLTWGNRFEPNLVARIPATVPVLTAAQAVEAAAVALGFPVPNLVVKSSEGGASQAVVFEGGDLSASDIPVRLVFQPMKDGSVPLAWDLSIHQHDGQHWWSLRMDAATGQLLDRADWVVSCHFGEPHSCGENHLHSGTTSAGFQTLPTFETPLMLGSYNVFPEPVESPSHGGRQLIIDPHDPNSSPYGWHDTNGAAGAEFTITRGNNVYAQLDDDNNNGTFGFAPDGGASLIFDYPIDFTQHPSNYTSAAITNLFYWNSFLHDFSYAYGFDEPSGNFQVNNYGNGGAGTDEVIADAQDSGGSNNANFATPPDGDNPRMQMYIWTYANPDRDSDLDNGVIAHEYAHGISNRLTGGPANVNCLSNQEQMGEGWSDFYALMTTLEPGDQGTDSRGIGTYVLNEPPSGTGIRPTPYSTSLAINPTTYADIDNLAIPHGVGYAWCSIIWEVVWALIGEHGMATGFDMAMNLVNEGMKLQPCSPGFVDGRDAILAADAALHNGDNVCLLWVAFAKRGLGYSASQGSSSTVGDETEAFDMPPACVLSIDPVVRSVCKPNDAGYLATVGGGNGDVTLTALSGVPAGATLSFTPNPVASPGTSIMLVSNIGAVTPGTYLMTIEAAGSTTTLETDVRLTVHEIAPPVPTLTLPANNATGVGLSPTLSWGANSGTDSFFVQVASNADFVTIVAADTLVGNTFQVTPSLNSLTQYWWRVKAKNACGVTIYSPVFTFTTANVVCLTRMSPNVPITIPGNQATTVNSLLNMPIQGTIQDVNVKTLTINHTWIDDLIISVKSPANTTTTVMNRPCDSENNILTNFDDEASTATYPCPPTNNGTYIPHAPLSVFDSQNPLGPWTLTVQDVFAQDGGSIQAWGLEVCYIPAATCGSSFTDSGGSGANYQNNENITWTLCGDSPGQVVSVNFTAFSTQSGSDLLRVYDGANASAPLIGTYSGTTIPGPFTATSASGCLTFVFTSNGTTTAAGWNANVTCCTPVAEVCNGVDDDCDNQIDEGLLLTFYQDSDSDSYGNQAVASQACTAPTGYVSNDDDCDDANAAVNPAATEVCNLVDDDCDLAIDEGVQLTFYQDSDNDTYGNQAVTTLACTAPTGYVSNDDDCNDANAAINPAATEVCNSVDDDCDLAIDEGVQLTFYQDSDNDSYGNQAVTTLACTAPTGYVANDDDCNDANAAINPAATEVCNSVDDDCDLAIDEGVLLTFYEDGDGDNYGNPFNTEQACAPSQDYVANDDDCNDANAAIHPGAPEVCNGVDDDCDLAIDEGVLLTFYQDGDSDSYGNQAVTSQACIAPAGYVANDDDCNDGNAAIHPGATEVCNLLDDDCDLAIDEGVLVTFFQDFDGDTYGNLSIPALACTAPSGYVANDDDCNDANAAIHPAAPEICNSLDDDCSGAPESATTTWTGTGDGVNWSDAANWSDGIVPLNCQDVVVPAGFNVVVPVGFDAVGRTLDVPFSGQIEVLGTMVIEN